MVAERGLEPEASTVKGDRALRIAAIAAAAVLAASTAQAQSPNGGVVPEHSWILVFISGHPGDFHDRGETYLPSLDDCRTAAAQAARSARSRGELLGGVKCIPMTEGDGPTIVFHKAGDP
jgi:hypothetical protein